MTKSVALIRIFVASPGDVGEERDCLLSVIAELNRGAARQAGAQLALIRWETDARPGVGADAQDVINQQLGLPDVFIGIMWSRFGTPTHRAESGTAEEFDRAYAAFRQQGCPSIMMYFKTAPFAPPSPEAAAQFQKVAAFRERVNAQGVLSWTYANVTEFERYVREHLTGELPSLLQNLDATQHTRAAMDPIALREQANGGGILLGQFIPSVRNLVRVADDLRTASDYYLATFPTSSAMFREQLTDMRNTVATYNAACDRVARQQVDFEEMIALFERNQVEALRKHSTTLLLRALDFQRGYEVSTQSSSRAYRTRYAEIARNWRQHRTLLQSRLDRTRVELDELETWLESEARAHAPAQQTGADGALWQTTGLLLDYRTQALRFASAIRAFLQDDFASGDASAKRAWTLAPCIEGMNAAFIEIEEHGMQLLVQLLRSARLDYAFGHGADALKRCRIFQWHEVRPLLNTSLVSIVSLVQGDTSEATLANIRDQARSWRQLVDVLEQQSRALDVRAARSCDATDVVVCQPSIATRRISLGLPR